MPPGFDRLVAKRRKIHEPPFPSKGTLGHTHYPTAYVTRGPSSKYTPGSTANLRAKRKIGILP